MKLAQKIALTYFRARLNILSLVSRRRAAEKALEIFSTPFRKPKNKNPGIFESAEKLSFKLEGELVTGYRWNHAAPRCVLIVHGFESHSQNFDRYISTLVKAGLQVLAFDAPAHGQSSGKRIILPTYVAMLKHINENFGPIHGYLSHSFGGLALAHYLEKIPHDAGTRVVFIAPATETTSAIDTFFRVLQLDDKLRKEFDKLIFEKGGVWPSHYSVRRAMQHINATVLWFHDEDDDLTPIQDALLVKEDAHAHVEFVITRGLGHRRIYRENKVVKRSIDFLCGQEYSSSNKPV